jgi:hypothetical protein
MEVRTVTVSNENPHIPKGRMLDVPVAVTNEQPRDNPPQVEQPRDRRQDAPDRQPATDRQTEQQQ